MGVKITDLSDLLSEDKHVRFTKNGPLYKVPGDIPVELYLRVTGLEGGELTDDHVRTLYADLLELFKYGDPEITELPAALPQVISAIPRIYGGPQVDSEERPTTRRTRGGSSRNSQSRKPSRS